MKKVTALLMVLTMMTVIFSACTSGEQTSTADPGTATTAAPGAETTAAPATQGGDQATTEAPAGEKRTDVKIPLAQVGSSMDPHNVPLTVDEHVLNNVYESFYYVEDDGTLSPRLAESYTVSDDGLEYVFKLRAGVKFHNGDPLTPEDVVYSFQRCIDNSYQTASINGIVKVEAVGDDSVKFTLESPNATFITVVNAVKVVNKKIVEELGTAYPVSASLAGTGPYYLDSYNQTTKIVIKAFPDYYNGEAAIKTIEWVPINDSSTQLMAFESGQFDICNVNAADWNIVTSNDKYSTSAVSGKHITYVTCYVGNPDSPLYDARVRQAIAYCIDKESMVAIAAEGFADVAHCMVNPATIADAPDTVYYTRDIEKAKALLTEAGYPNGFNVTISTISGVQGRYVKCSEVLAENLAEIGITAEIVQGESASVLPAWKEGKYEIGVSGQTWSSTYYNFYPWIDGESRSNNIFGTNENIDVAYIRNRTTDALKENDFDKRAAIFAEIDKYVNEEVAGYIPIMYVQQLYAWDKNLNATPPVYNYYIYNWSWK